jgi:hypothetical protein
VVFFLALPVGMPGKKSEWAAFAKDAAGRPLCRIRGFTGDSHANTDLSSLLDIDDFSRGDQRLRRIARRHGFTL